MGSHKIKGSTCTLCRKSQKSTLNLKKHVSKHIFNVSIYQCSICKKHFKEKIRLLQHNQESHNTCSKRKIYAYKNSFVCSLCGRRFWKKSVCVNHIAFHSGMSHECKRCGWMFDTWYRVAVHEGLWHGGVHQACQHFRSSHVVHKCRYIACGWTFESISELQLHYTSIHNDSVDESTKPSKKRRKISYGKRNSKEKANCQSRYLCPYELCEIICEGVCKFQKHVYSRHGVYLFPLERCKPFLIQ